MFVCFFLFLPFCCCYRMFRSLLVKLWNLQNLLYYSYLKSTSRPIVAKWLRCPQEEIRNRSSNNNSRNRRRRWIECNTIYNGIDNNNNNNNTELPMLLWIWILLYTKKKQETNNAHERMVCLFFFWVLPLGGALVSRYKFNGSLRTTRKVSVFDIRCRHFLPISPIIACLVGCGIELLA